MELVLTNTYEYKHSKEADMGSCNIHKDHPHEHGPNCGHTAIEYDGHIDYLVDRHLHHPHGDHCDDHGPVKVAG